MSPKTKGEILRDRALMLERSRQFFKERSILEVDCPALSSCASFDEHILLIPALVDEKPYTLHSSPEYGMKQLLAQGVGDCYQLSHVFRDKEAGKRHHPEFTMVEWYRLGFSLDQMIEESLDYIRLFVTNNDFERLTYRQAFQKYADLDPFTASAQALKARLKEHGITTAFEGDFYALRDLVISELIEPQLNCLHVITHFPADQASLATTTLQEGYQVAERFEVFCKGFELANGYNELTDVAIHEERFRTVNSKRPEEHKAPFPKMFLAALKKGIPPCCGVAVGFDRLMMIRQGVSSITQVLALPIQ